MSVFALQERSLPQQSSLRNSAGPCDAAVMTAVKRVNRRAAEYRRVTQREIQHRNRYRNIAGMTKDFEAKPQESYSTNPLRIA